MKLYDYASSSAAYRVRIALNLKGIAYERVNIDLLKDGGQQHSDMYRSVNPQELIPALETEAGVLAQSLSIIEYLDETGHAPVPREDGARRCRDRLDVVSALDPQGFPCARGDGEPFG
jgi:glutathione S-transferase